MDAARLCKMLQATGLQPLKWIVRVVIHSFSTVSVEIRRQRIR